MKGYERMLVEIGYTTQSAHPWQKEDLQAVLEHIDKQLETAQGCQLVKLQRDAFTMTILWETCSRGATAVNWKLSNITSPQGKRVSVLGTCRSDKDMSSS